MQLVFMIDPIVILNPVASKKLVPASFFFKKRLPYFV